MKKIAFILFPLIIIFLIVLNLLLPTDKYKDFKKMNYKLNGKSYKLLVADTPEKWQKGLMYYRSLDGVDGMIFLFPDKQYRSFWNKNTYMNLDLIWLSDDEVLERIALPSVEKSKNIVTVSSPAPVNRVMELSIQ